jgi:hypothetical protein
MSLPIFRNAEPTPDTLLAVCRYVRANDLLLMNRPPEKAPDGAAGWRFLLRRAFPDATTLPKGKGAGKALQALIRDADKVACDENGIVRYQHLSDEEKAQRAAEKAARKAQREADQQQADADPVQAVAQSIAAMTPDQRKALRDALK